MPDQGSDSRFPTARTRGFSGGKGGTRIKRMLDGHVSPMNYVKNESEKETYDPSNLYDCGA